MIVCCTLGLAFSLTPIRSLGIDHHFPKGTFSPVTSEFLDHKAKEKSPIPKRSIIRKVIEVTPEKELPPPIPTQLKSSQIRIFEIDGLGKKTDTHPIKARHALNGDLYLFELIDNEGNVATTNYYRVFNAGEKGFSAEQVELDENNLKALSLQDQVRQNKVALLENAKLLELEITRAKEIQQLREESQKLEQDKQRKIAAELEAAKQQFQKEQLEAQNQRRLDEALLKSYTSRQNAIELANLPTLRLIAGMEEAAKFDDDPIYSRNIAIFRSQMAGTLQTIEDLKSQRAELSRKLNFPLQSTPLSMENLAAQHKAKVEKDSGYIESGRRIAADWAALREKHEGEDREMARKGPLEWKTDYSQYRIGGKEVPDQPTIFNKQVYPGGYVVKHPDLSVTGRPQGLTAYAQSIGDWDPVTNSRISDAYREKSETYEPLDISETGGLRGRSRDLVKSRMWDPIFMKPKSKLTDLNKRFYDHYPRFKEEE